MMTAWRVGLIGIAIVILMTAGWAVLDYFQIEPSFLNSKQSQVSDDFESLKANDQPSRADGPKTATPSALPTQSPQPVILWQSVSGPGGRYQTSLPESWRIEEMEGEKGVQLSYFQAVSPDYATRTDPDFEGPFEPIYYDTGAILTIHVTKGTEGNLPTGEILTTKAVTVAGEPASWTSFVEPSTLQGEIIHVNVNFQDTNFLLRLGYNPATFPDGPAILERILADWQFTEG